MRGPSTGRVVRSRMGQASRAGSANGAANRYCVTVATGGGVSVPSTGAPALSLAAFGGIPLTTEACACEHGHAAVRFALRLPTSAVGVATVSSGAAGPAPQARPGADAARRRISRDRRGSPRLRGQWNVQEQRITRHRCATPGRDRANAPIRRRRWQTPLADPARHRMPPTLDSA